MGKAQRGGSARGAAKGGAARNGSAGGFFAWVRVNAAPVVLSVCALVFLVLLAQVLGGELLRIDRAAYWLVVEHLRAPWLTPVMEAFSGLATPAALVTIVAVVAAFAPRARYGAVCAANLVLVTVLNQVLKLLVQRPRPEGFRLAEATGFSFPSGHSMVAMAFFGLLIWMVWRTGRSRAVRVGCTAVFAALIALIGLSRIYLGVHYASDVLAGFCAALAWLVLFTRAAAPWLSDGTGC